MLSVDIKKTQIQALENSMTKTNTEMINKGEFDILCLEPHQGYKIVLRILSCGIYLDY
jgi:hypothetical protein